MKILANDDSTIPLSLKTALESIRPSSDSAGPWSSVVFVTFEHVGCLPVLINDGIVNADILRFAHFTYQQGKSLSTLNLLARGLGYFSDFLKWAEPRPSERPIVSAFFEALVHGNTDLAWAGVSIVTARLHVESVAKFIDHFCDVRGQDSPNPLIDVPRNWASTVAELIRRHKSDPLYHLFFTTKRSRDRRRRLCLPLQSADRALPLKKGNVEKAFRLEDFITLIEFEDNPRDRMIWLLLGGGGLRESEAVHTFISDISLDDDSLQAAVLLAHPTYGPLNTDNVGPTRKAYLKQHFGLLPRNQLPSFDIRFAGWKGMRFQKKDTAGVTWLHPSFGAVAWRSHVEYLRLRSATNAKHHPWYFVNLRSSNIGEPLTLSNLYQLLAAACKRLGLRSPSNPHSLRHMYVDTLVHVYAMTQEEAQIMVRHRDSQSTAVYMDTAKNLTRQALERLGKQPTIKQLNPRL